MATEAQTIQRLDEIGKEFNPCGFHQVDGKTKCVGVANNFTPCCSGCKHLTKEGCSVSSISCKFYFCKWSWDRLPENIQDEITQLLKDYEGEFKFRFSGRAIPQKTMLYALGHVP